MKPFGKYQLVRRIAAGGMAEVYLATGPNPRGAELIALKLILPHIAEDESFMAMFLQEAKLTAPLTHPNLVHLFDLGMTDGRLYLAMEYIPGRALNEVLDRCRDADKEIGAPLAAAAVRQACLGLHHAHEARDSEGRDLGLIHRDVSPHNLMLDETGTIKVVDFGIAKATSQSEVSRAGTLKGKVGFMSPEQLKSKPLDRRVDIFALGAVLYELAAGRPLFHGRNDAEVLQRMLFEPPPDLLRQGLPPALAKIIGVAIDRDRSKRYATTQEMAEALEEYLGAQLNNTPKQLGGLVRSLFPRSPRTIAEAEAEISAPGRKVAGGNEVLVTREARARENTPTDPEQLSARKREVSRAKSRPELPPARPVERSAGRPAPRATGPTDPAARPHVDPDDVPTNNEINVSAYRPSISEQTEIPTRVGRSPLDPPLVQSPFEDEDHTVSTVSDAMRPIRAYQAPPVRQTKLMAGLVVGGGVVLGLGGLLWKLMTTPEAVPQPAVQVRVMAQVDSGLPAATLPEPIDAGSAPEVPKPSLPSPVPSSPPAVGPTATQGLLSVPAPPTAHVLVDGREIGIGSIHDFPLAAGRHKVVLTTGDGRKIAHEDVIVRAGHSMEFTGRSR